jgi:hypothetical protein
LEGDAMNKMLERMVQEAREAYEMTGRESDRLYVEELEERARLVKKIDLAANIAIAIGVACVVYALLAAVVAVWGPW